MRRIPGQWGRLNSSALIPYKDYAALSTAESPWPDKLVSSFLNFALKLVAVALKFFIASSLFLRPLSFRLTGRNDSPCDY
jgi:hypothetical protein